MFPDNTYATITFIDDERNINLLLQSISFLFFFFVFCSSAFAQWANNTSLNTKLVVNTSNPINILAHGNGNSGIFLVWEDNKSAGEPDIFFLHVDGEGKASFNAAGKPVSLSSGHKINPQFTSSAGNSAIIIWKDYSFNLSGQLICQKVDSRGNLLWGEYGLQLTSEKVDAIDYNLVSDKQGNSLVSFISRSTTGGGSSVICQKISTDGRKLFPDEGIVVHNSKNKKGMTSVVADDSGGVFILWTELINNKMIVQCNRVDAGGKLSFGKKPVMISGQNNNVIKYSAYKTNDKKVYVVWQLHKGDVVVFHQMIGSNGKILWKENGLPVTRRTSDITNPQAYVHDNEIYLTWTDEVKKVKDIFIQKYNFNGKEIWKRDGVPVTKINGEQFGQRIAGGENGNVIIAWVDRRIDSLSGNIYLQKINSDGEAMWGENGIPAGTYSNSQKSYLSLVSDENGGAIVVFKDNRAKNNDIYAQKIFNNGTFVSHITNFSTELVGESVKLNWQSSNETEGTIYNIERTTKLEEAQTYWSIVGSIPALVGEKNNKYQFEDKPDQNGTLFYRIIQSGSQNYAQSSEILRINYFETSNQVTVAQNNPNPFSDSTVIPFYLPEKLQVTLEFFDFRVEKVGEIIKEVFPAGTNKVTFVANDLPSGIYFYRFKAGDFVEVKKMVITK